MSTFTYEFPDGRKFEIDYSVVSHGSPSTGPNMYGPGDPPEGPELEIDQIRDAEGNNVTTVLSDEDSHKIEDAMYEQFIDDEDDYYDPGEWHDGLD